MDLVDERSGPGRREEWSWQMRGVVLENLSVVLKLAGVVLLKEKVYFQQMKGLVLTDESVVWQCSECSEYGRAVDVLLVGYWVWS